MDKLHGDFVHRDIDCNSAESGSGTEKPKQENEKQKRKSRSKSGENGKMGNDGPEPPMRNQSIDYKPAPLLHHPKMMQQMHHQHMQEIV